MKTVVPSLAFAVMMLTTWVSQAQVPDTISVQLAIDSAGVPVNTTVPVTMTLYTVNGGSLVKNFPLGTQTISDGILSVDLAVDDVGFDQPLELGVTVGSDPEMTPRTPLRSAPYALGLRALEVRPDTDTGGNPAPSLMGGHPFNSAPLFAFGVTIGGGGSQTAFNRVWDHFGTVGGGAGNNAGMAQGADATAEQYATVGGGLRNEASGERSTIAGGQQGTASGGFSFIGGGNLNQASGGASTVGGGLSNEATGLRATVAGGTNNEASGENSTVSGGEDNTASGPHAFAGGGEGNLAVGSHSTVGGGSLNEATGNFSTVAGGRLNAARGTSSFAGGVSAKADHLLSFVWNGSDGLPGDSLHSTGNSQFVVRANGGLRYWHENALVVTADERGLIPGADETYNLGTSALRWDTLWAVTHPVISDERRKADVTDLEYGLDAALKLRPVSYRYTDTRRNARRLGLIAQEVAEVVPDIVVSSAGVYGLQYDGLIPVLIAAIQDQQKTIEAQSARIDRLEQELNPR